MNLIDESNSSGANNKKILVACGAGILVLLIIIILLLVYVYTKGNGKTSLVVDNTKYSASKYLMEKDGVLYVGIEDLATMTKNGYSYKRGAKDSEDENSCYITSSLESTFFRADSKEFYKVLGDTDEIEYYEMQNPVIKENGKMYMPVDNIKEAFNVRVIKENNSYNIMSIAYLEGAYNLDKSKNSNYFPDESIVWNTKYASNKKLLKNNLVIVKDDKGKLGVAIVSRTADKKKVVVSTTKIIDPKYDDIEYVEKYNQLVVETSNGKGIVQLSEKDGAFSADTLILPQYEEIKPINDKLYLVSSTSESGGGKKYGIVNQNGDIVLASEYDAIGFDISKFTNNGLADGYIVYDNLIPVMKDNKYGFVNLSGKVVINLEYTGLGYVGTNSNGNVLIIPEIDGIVVKKDKNYGIISKTGKVLMNNVITRVYKETVDGKEQYTMVYNDKKYNVVSYIKDEAAKKQASEKKENNNTQNKANEQKANEQKTTETKTTNTKKD